MTDVPQMSLQTWVDTLAERLGAMVHDGSSAPDDAPATHSATTASHPDVGDQALFDFDEESMHIILDLARDAAHEVVRPAAPLTTFLVGVAVGRGASLGAVAARATELTQTVGQKTPDTSH